MGDLLIRGAIVIDGTGGAQRFVDVAVCDGRISAVEVPETAADRATFDDPHRYPEGIEIVIVNGVVVSMTATRARCLAASSVGEVRS